jgi:hypothetical protein
MKNLKSNDQKKSSHKHQNASTHQKTKMIKSSMSKQSFEQRSSGVRPKNTETWKSDRRFSRQVGDPENVQKVSKMVKNGDFGQKPGKTAKTAKKCLKWPFVIDDTPETISRSKSRKSGKWETWKSGNPENRKIGKTGNSEIREFGNSEKLKICKICNSETEKSAKNGSKNVPKRGPKNGQNK